MEKAVCGCVTKANLEEVLASDEKLKCDLHEKKLIRGNGTFVPNMIYFT